MNKITFFTLTYLLLSACAQSTFPKGTPSCILNKIEELKEKNDKSAFVYQYTNHGQIVFLVSPGCCDMFTELYDEECNYICAPSGGFTGKGDGKCVDLDLQDEVVIWKPNLE